MTEAAPAVLAIEVTPRAKASNYPDPLAARVAERQKRILGDLYGLKSFGVNLTRLPPGCPSSLHHRHSVQDEFIWVVEGFPTLVTDAGETQLSPGMCAGFPRTGTAHHLENRSDADVLYLEIGDRAGGDMVEYPLDDLVLVEDKTTGRRSYAHKDGTPY